MGLLFIIAEAVENWNPSLLMLKKLSTADISKKLINYNNLQSIYHNLPSISFSIWAKQPNSYSLFFIFLK